MLLSNGKHDHDAIFVYNPVEEEESEGEENESDQEDSGTDTSEAREEKAEKANIKEQAQAGVPPNQQRELFVIFP